MFFPGALSGRSREAPFRLASASSLVRSARIRHVLKYLLEQEEEREDPLEFGASSSNDRTVRLRRSRRRSGRAPAPARPAPAPFRLWAAPVAIGREPCGKRFEEAAQRLSRPRAASGKRLGSARAAGNIVAKPPQGAGKRLGIGAIGQACWPARRFAVGGPSVRLRDFGAES